MRRLNGIDSLVQDRSQSAARPWHTKLQTPVVGASPMKQKCGQEFLKTPFNEIMKQLNLKIQGSLNEYHHSSLSETLEILLSKQKAPSCD